MEGRIIMAYQKNTWVARTGTNLNRFLDQNGNELILTPAPSEVLQQGTPFSVDWMNNIEEGIESVSNEADNTANGLQTHEDNTTIHLPSTGILPINKGGTGATSATAARTSLGAASSSHTHSLSSSTITGTLPISKGGTGATTQSAALTALGIKAGGVGLTIPANQDRASIEVTFDTPYEDSGYAVMILPSTTVAGGTYGRTATFGDKTATGFTAYIGVNNKLSSSQSSGFTWATIPYVNQ